MIYCVHNCSASLSVQKKALNNGKEMFLVNFFKKWILKVESDYCMYSIAKCQLAAESIKIQAAQKGPVHSEFCCQHQQGRFLNHVQIIAASE